MTSHAIAHYCARVHGDVIFLFDAFYIPFYMPLRVGLFCATVFYATLLRFLYGFFCAWELLCLRAGKTDPKTVSGAASLRFPYDFFDATSQRFFHITSSMRLCRGFSMSFMSLICVFEESSSGHSLLSFLAHFRGQLLHILRRTPYVRRHTPHGEHLMCGGEHLTENSLWHASCGEHRSL